MVHFRIGRADHLGGEPVGEDFLGPDIVEPFHRHIVAEPHVGRFMRDQLRATEQFVGRGGCAQEDAPVIVERGTGMFHTAVLEVGQHNEVVFGKRIGDTGIFFQIIQRIKDQREYLGLLGQFLRIGFPVIHRKGPSGAFGKGTFEFSGHKGEKIGAERLRFREADGLAPVVFLGFFFDIRIGNGRPTIRNGKRQRIPRLEVRLVEAGKQRARAVGDE